MASSFAGQIGEDKADRPGRSGGGVGDQALQAGAGRRRSLAKPSTMRWFARDVVRVWYEPWRIPKDFMNHLQQRGQAVRWCKEAA